MSIKKQVVPVIYIAPKTENAGWLFLGDTLIGENAWCSAAEG
jgi:hypothetical protein